MVILIYYPSTSYPVSRSFRVSSDEVFSLAWLTYFNSFFAFLALKDRVITRASFKIAVKSFRLQLIGNFLQWGCWCTKISSDCHEKSQEIYYHHFVRVLRSICLLLSPPSRIELSQWYFRYVISYRFNPVFFFGR